MPPTYTSDTNNNNLSRQEIINKWKASPIPPSDGQQSNNPPKKQPQIAVMNLNTEEAAAHTNDDFIESDSDENSEFDRQVAESASSAEKWGRL